MKKNFAAHLVRYYTQDQTRDMVARALRAPDFIVAAAIGAAAALGMPAEHFTEMFGDALTDEARKDLHALFELFDTDPGPDPTGIATSPGLAGQQGAAA